MLNTHAKDLGLEVLEKRELEVNVFLRKAAETVSADAVLLHLHSNIDPQFRLEVLADTVPRMPFTNTYGIQEF